MATYYVATNGSDSGNGSINSPWRTISRAMDANIGGGDTVIVRPGTYTESVFIDRNGTANNHFTLKSEVPGEALIRGTQWNAVFVNANYVTVEGFDISGRGGGDGIEANGRHHINILNNVIHGNGESGIQFNGSDFIRVEGNVTYDNASKGWFSGISIYQNRNITRDPSTDGFRTIIRDNISYNNVTKSGAHTDGNGIIIDDFQSTQTAGFPNYTFATLVENNLVYGNGGKGIQVTWSDYVTVRNNTSYHNNVDPLNTGTWRGELSNAQSSNNTWVNNIAVADPGINRNNTAIDNTSYGGYRNQDVVWHNNITFNGTAGQASVRTDGGNSTPTAANGNRLGVDPRFYDADGGNFWLRPDSPGLNNGSGSFGLSDTDLAGNDRTVGQVDIGAYEMPGSATSNTAPVGRDDFGFAAVDGTTTIIRAADLLANDTDANGDRLSISGVSSPTGGTVALTSGGDVAFTPTAGFDGTARFTYAVSDGEGGVGSARVLVEVKDSAPAPKVAFAEYGTASVNHNWTTVTFKGDYDKPTILAFDMSGGGWQIVEPEIRAIDTVNRTFQIRLDETSNLDDKHLNEKVSWLVMEEGTWRLADGTVFEAGTVTTSRTLGEGMVDVDFARAFERAPHLFSTLNSANDPDWVTTRHSNVDASGFRIALQEEEAAAPGHRTETIGYIAVANGAGGGPVKTISGLTEKVSSFPFPDTFFADMQTVNGDDPAVVRVRNGGLFIQEEMSLDTEVAHASERVSVIGFAGSSGQLEGIELLA